MALAAKLAEILREKAGRIIWNGYPTGVEVCPAMHHGGPYPATSDARFTSVGTAAIQRFVRPACYQNFPEIIIADRAAERECPKDLAHGQMESSRGRMWA